MISLQVRTQPGSNSKKCEEHVKAHGKDEILRACLMRNHGDIAIILTHDMHLCCNMAGGHGTVGSAKQQFIMVFRPSKLSHLQ
jgi:hypothetical protein